MPEFLFALLSLAPLAGSPDLDLLRSRAPGVTVESVNPAPIDGWFEILTAGSRVYYLSADGRLLLDGDLIDLDAGRNLTDARRAEGRREALTDLAPTFRYPVPDEAARVVIVTDLDCPYCRNLHARMDEYARVGIAIDYLLLTRGGPGSDPWDRATRAACAPDPSAALTRAMAGETLAPARCDHALAGEAELAAALGATSTPTVILPDGEVVVGYVGASQLAARLGLATQP